MPPVEYNFTLKELRKVVANTAADENLPVESFVATIIPGDDAVTYMSNSGILKNLSQQKQQELYDFLALDGAIAVLLEPGSKRPPFIFVPMPKTGAVPELLSGDGFVLDLGLAYGDCRVGKKGGTPGCSCATSCDGGACMFCVSWDEGPGGLILDLADYFDPAISLDEYRLGKELPLFVLKSDLRGNPFLSQSLLIDPSKQDTIERGILLEILATENPSADPEQWLDLSTPDLRYLVNKN